MQPGSSLQQLLQHLDAAQQAFLDAIERRDSAAMADAAQLCVTIVELMKARERKVATTN